MPATPHSSAPHISTPQSSAHPSATSAPETASNTAPDTAPDAQNVETTYHYQVIARAIAAIDAARPALSLDDLAAHVGLSPAHFQRLFSAWAGVSPKRYQQYLALDHARDLLRDHHSTLATAHAVGLSGSSRLHDLFVRWEAMSPGDYARGGAGLTIRWGWFDSPFGPALAMATARGLCGLAFGAETGREHAFADLAARWPKARFAEDPATVAPEVAAIFSGKGEARLHMIGAPFQIKVWEALLSVPPGTVTTYSDIAGAIGHPRATRAVGTAVGKNPVGYLIPCHRALRKSGALGGYHWGLEIKRAMLARESAQRDGAT